MNNIDPYIVQPPARPHSHYFKDVSKLKTIDVYRVLKLFNVTDPCLQHAIKKLLVAGGRGAGKDPRQDIQEAIDSLHRALGMMNEDSPLMEPPARAQTVAEIQVRLIADAFLNFNMTLKQLTNGEVLELKTTKESYDWFCSLPGYKFTYSDPKKNGVHVDFCGVRITS